MKKTILVLALFLTISTLKSAIAAPDIRPYGTLKEIRKEAVNWIKESIGGSIADNEIAYIYKMIDDGNLTGDIVRNNKDKLLVWLESHLLAMKASTLKLAEPLDKTVANPFFKGGYSGYQGYDEFSRDLSRCLSYAPIMVSVKQKIKQWVVDNIERKTLVLFVNNKPLDLDKTAQALIQAVKTSDVALDKSLNGLFDQQKIKAAATLAVQPFLTWAKANSFVR